MIDSQNQGSFSDNDWHDAFEQALQHLSDLMDALDALHDEIKAQEAVVRLLDELANPLE
jgi:uncharacterized protein YukE